MITESSNKRYSYSYNRIWLCIYRDGKDIAFLQDSEAHCLADALNAATEEVQQYLLSQYDYSDVQDENKTISDYLENLIDQNSLSYVLDAIANICLDKSEHLLSNWQDTQSSKAWSNAANAVLNVITSVDC